VTLGTGVGGGIIINGVPLRGPDGTAGEVGHICVEPLGLPCGCGSFGCLEQYASATAVVRMAAEMAALQNTSTALSVPGLTSLDVYEAGKQGNALAIAVFARMGYYLGIVLAGLVDVLNPEMIVLGGGLSSAWDLFIDHTRDQIFRRAFREPAERVKLVRAELGDDAGSIGAAYLAFSSK
jgi:glucokinase